MKKLLLLAIVLACLFVASCSFVRSLIPVDQVIATDFAVTPQWQEIRPTNPMTSSHRRQMIMVKVDGAKLPETITNQATNTSKTDWNSLAFNDGKLVTPELELIDEKGIAHPLHGSEESAKGRGYSVDLDDGKSNTSGRTFVAVRIRSNTPFRAREIRWFTFDPK